MMFRQILGRGALAAAFTLALITAAHAATLTIQSSGESSLAPTFAAASSGGDTFANTKGDVIIILQNASGSAITGTVSPSVSTIADANRGTLTKAAATVTVPFKSCNGGANFGVTCAADSACPAAMCGPGTAILGPFHTLSFNDNTGRASITYSGVTTLGVAAVRVPE